MKWTTVLALGLAVCWSIVPAGRASADVAGILTIPAGYTASFTNASLGGCDALAYGYQLNGGANVTLGSIPAHCTNGVPVPFADVTIGPFATAQTLRVFLNDKGGGSSCDYNYYSDGPHARVLGTGPWTVDIMDGDGCSSLPTDTRLPVGDGNLHLVVTTKDVTPRDTTPPVIDPVVSGTAGKNGWYTSDVQVQWSVHDPESAIVSSSGCDPTVITTDTPGTVLTCTATSAGGTTGRSVTIKRDTVAPVVTGTPDRPADSAGWYNHPLAVTWSGNPDDLSGIAGCDAPSQYGGPDLSTATVTGHCTDGAGNPGTGTFALKYDSHAPSIVFSGNAGTYTVDQQVTLGCSATDPLLSDGSPGSGVASSTCVGLNVPAYTLNLGTNTVSATASDVAGNSSTASTDFTVSVDGPSLCALTVRLVQEGAANQGLPPGHRKQAEKRAAEACGALLSGGGTSPDDRATAIATYQRVVHKLADLGLLTPDQAELLVRLSGKL